MTDRERAQNAFKATRALGIPDKEVRPVLVNLIKLFDKNWELIEAEDYRALIDAYFELKENKRGSDEKVLMEHSISERPSKRPHLEQQEDQTSSSTASLSLVEKNSSSIAPICSTYKRASCMSSSEQPTVEPSSSHLWKEKVPSNCHTREIIKLRTEQSVNDVADFAEPPAVVHPSNVFRGSFNGSLFGNNLVTHLRSQCDASRSKDSMDCKSNFLMASSTSGEVKISLNCDPAVRRQNYKVPDFDAVLKYLEDKYIRAHKLVTPEFSVKTLFKDLCECYMQVGQLHDPVPNNKALRIGNSDMVMEKKASSSCRLSYSCNNLVKAKHKATTCGQKRSVRSLSDITKGTENVKISLVDEIGNEDFPKFTYMPQNIIYQNAYVLISLARIADVDCCSSCSGDCLSSRIPCACARETGGEFAYTPKGLLKDDFLTACVCMRREPKKDNFVYCQDCPFERSKNEQCKGHLLRKFIKECWRKCGCNMTCANRVVQRGITCSLQVFMTHQGKGWGLRTLQDLPKGSFICEYVGEILTNMELYERNIQNRGSNKHTYPVTLDADWGSEKVLRDEEALCLDATFSGNVARFINHRCHDANLIDIPVEVETPDRHYYHLAFFTTRDVSASEELTWDYGIDFDDRDHPIKAFKCSCESAYCRDVNRTS